MKVLVRLLKKILIIVNDVKNNELPTNFLLKILSFEIMFHFVINYTFCRK